MVYPASHRLGGTSKPRNDVCTGAERAHGNRESGTSAGTDVDPTPHWITL